MLLCIYLLLEVCYLLRPLFAGTLSSPEPKLDHPVYTLMLKLILIQNRRLDHDHHDDNDYDDDDLDDDDDDKP